MADVAQDLLCQTTLSWSHFIGMRGKTHQRKQHKLCDCSMFIHSYYVIIISQIQSYYHFQGHSFNITGNCTVHISPKDYIGTLKVIKR